LKQFTLFEEGILQSPQSKADLDFACFPDLTKKNLNETVEHWNRVHEGTNWDEIFKFMPHGKKKQLMLKIKMIGTAEPREYCGTYQTEGCTNYQNHPGGRYYVINKKLSCKRSECKVCWGDWLVREASRITERIEKFRNLAQRNGFRSSKPIHVIASPPNWLWNLSWTELKKMIRKLITEAGIVGGVLMFHGCRRDKKTGNWYWSPHFHIVCYGWLLSTQKLNRKGWIIKNKGIRKNSTGVYSTVSYLLSHTAIAKGIHSVTWFGDLSYRSKYALELKREIEESDADRCPYCSQYLVLFEMVGLDRPPPDQEWFGLVERTQACPVETIEQLLERKPWYKTGTFTLKELGKPIKPENKMSVDRWIN